MNISKLDEILAEYKQSFVSRWNDEKYKWQAIKHFQQIQNNEFSSFAEKFLASTEKHYNILATGSYWQPRSMIGHFCDACGDKNISDQFDMLYDETIDLRQRIESFISYFSADERIGKVSQKAGKTLKTNQDPRSVSVYLSSQYPDKYYLYMPSIYDATKSIFDFEQPKGFTPIDKMLKYFEFCNEICEHIKRDNELIDMVSSVITDEEYDDKSFHILVQDILFFYANNLKEINASNPLVTTENSNQEKTEVNTWLLTWNPTRWDWTDYEEAIEITKSGIGYYIGWTCANTHILVGDRVFMAKLGDAGTPKGIFATGYVISECYQEESYDPTKENKARYVDVLLTEIYDYRTEPILNMDKLKEKFPSQNWSPQASGIAIKPYIATPLLKAWDEIGNHSTVIRNETHIQKYNIKYTKEDFLKEVFITEVEYNKLYNLLKHKKNIILQGAPGVGKTFAAKRLAYSIMGEKDTDRVQFVQFHQSYSYEDFIEGYRPLEDGGFELRDGVFKKFCDKASRDTERDYFFIIDEINRGNMSKIFGELLMLIEADKRGDEHSMRLVYNLSKTFSVPENVHIIGMMNTADRSLAMIDYALRRRFSFYTMRPAFDSDGFKLHSDKVKSDLFYKAVGAVKNLNEVIVADKSLGKGFEIGHSYFCTDKPEDITDESVRNIVEFELIPIIEEYWFDNDTKLDTEREKLEALLGDENGVI